MYDNDENKRNAMDGAKPQNMKNATTKPLKMTARSCDMARQAATTKNKMPHYLKKFATASKGLSGFNFGESAGRFAPSKYSLEDAAHVESSAATL